MKRLFSFIAVLLLAAMVAATVQAIPVSEGFRTIVLGDGTTVHLVMDVDKEQLKLAPMQRLANSTTGGRRYYYLPTNLRLAKRPDGVPEFLFMKFTTERSEAQGGVNGALMHFLMLYGLTPEQERELKAKLTETHDTLLGAMRMTSNPQAQNFAVTSATMKDETMTKSLITSGRAPLLSGERIAVASRFTGNGAQLMASTLEKARSIADCSITMVLDYTVNTPALEGTATFHADKLKTSSDELERKWEHKNPGKKRFLFWNYGGTHEYKHEEIRKQWDFLMENKIVEVNFVETGVTDERVNKIRDAVFQQFLDSFFKEDTPAALAATDEPREGDAAQPPAIQGDKFESKIVKVKTEVELKNRHWSLSYSLPVTSTVTLTGNLASWYDGVRDNPSCVSVQNLNDPFFTHRDISFILDLDAKEMFDEAVNQVVVNVRKNRSSGRPFADNRVFDAQKVKEKGITQLVQYARGDDTNPETYEYQTQWSLKGGNVFPASPKWQKGDWAGVTLSPPVRPFNVELEGDLAELKEKGITRVAAEVHVSQFGKEKVETIQLPVSGENPVIAKRLYRDRDMEHYAYRLIFNHKTAGKLVGDWVKNQTDGYIYAVIPEDVLTAEAFKTRAVAAATGAIEKVLEKLGGGTQ